jgi:hypothetical protein
MCEFVVVLPVNKRDMSHVNVITLIATMLHEVASMGTLSDPSRVQTKIETYVPFLPFLV